jgi:hypothetical protein
MRTSPERTEPPVIISLSMENSVNSGKQKVY